MPIRFQPRLPNEILAKILDLLKNPDDIYSFIQGVPQVLPYFQKRYKVVIIDFPEPLLRIALSSSSYNKFIPSTTISGDSYLAVLKDLFEKMNDPMKLKICFRQPNMDHSSSDNYSCTSFKDERHHDDGILTCLDLQQFSRMEFSELMFRDHTKSGRRSTLRNTFRELHLCDFGDYLNLSECPGLPKLAFSRLKDTNNIDESTILPKYVSIFNDTAHQFPFSLISSLDIKYLVLRNRNSSTGNMVSGIKLPRLKKLEIHNTGDNELIRIGNIETELLEELEIRSPQNLQIENIITPRLKVFTLAAQSCLFTGEIHIPAVKKFKISLRSDPLTRPSSSTSKNPLGFLENAHHGILKGGCHHIINGLDMKDLRSLKLKGAPYKGYPFDTKFPVLYSLEIEYDDKMKHFPKLKSPSLKRLVLHHCFNLESVEWLSSDEEISTSLKEITIRESSEPLRLESLRLKSLDKLVIHSHKDINLLNCEFDSLLDIYIHHWPAACKTYESTEVLDDRPRVLKFDKISAPKLKKLTIESPILKSSVGLNLAKEYPQIEELILHTSEVIPPILDINPWGRSNLKRSRIKLGDWS
ncbi:hypothetical protein BN7_2764 [Wickerhamomyces ciferrii]|uniref:Internalin-I n=1 Tax=Wickerhamomyces ciferrii (strain ATCC 14091 / BCRC 22168 / CBS 111 / JCM 3599 / NBRC 0793 / NRRL Y-1031 F-60-10) TaxID=1206466 RepID=K0KLY6_WICCF|nr:uncharacterized protein BN7_2764 [Wickerhamomyces ciferrii]CCH43217.1 hypothetical protein BN7_2764 [Wickerhamomyces ciferrii]